MSRRQGKNRKPKKPSQKATPQWVDLKIEELEEILERAETSVLTAEDRGKLQASVETLAWLIRELEKKNASLTRLRQLFGLVTSEKTREVLGKPEGDPAKDAAANDTPGDPPKEKPKRKPKGHGRNGADAYHGAEKVGVLPGM
jgi:hypothetical protein